jgi:hypothetical protein
MAQDAVFHFTYAFKVESSNQDCANGFSLAIEYLPKQNLSQKSTFLLNEDPKSDETLDLISFGQHEKDSNWRIKLEDFFSRENLSLLSILFYEFFSVEALMSYASGKPRALPV